MLCFFYLKGTKWRNSVGKEITLLKDCYFYRQLIEKYKTFVSELEESNYYKTFRKEVTEETGIEPSRYSQPREIYARLEELKKTDKNLEDFLSKIKIG